MSTHYTLNMFSSVQTQFHIPMSFLCHCLSIYLFPYPKWGRLFWKTVKTVSFFLFFMLKFHNEAASLPFLTLLNIILDHGWFCYSVTNVSKRRTMTFCRLFLAVKKLIRRQMWKHSSGSCLFDSCDVLNDFTPDEDQHLYLHITLYSIVDDHLAGSATFSLLSPLPSFSLFLLLINNTALATLAFLWFLWSWRALA